VCRLQISAANLKKKQYLPEIFPPARNFCRQRLLCRCSLPSENYHRSAFNEVEIVFFGEHNEGLTRLEIVRGEVCIAEPLCLTRVIREYHRHCIDHVFRLASIPSHYIYTIIIIVIIIIVIIIIVIIIIVIIIGFIIIIVIISIMIIIIVVIIIVNIILVIIIIVIIIGFIIIIIITIIVIIIIVVINYYYYYYCYYYYCYYY